ncbi:MAG: amidophosphoribosyltransferase [Oscillospiraceae bacterium]|jgi:amidophosphoribosyltransferase|nr:amidophosphoribosyltransferase [Oscillospiraceae bacterium]
MGGIFGVASRTDCVMDLFFGTDYHSHLGTRRGGMAVLSDQGIERAIHNIENSPFRTKFERDSLEMKGTMGIGCISDTDPQPLIVRSHLGNYAITTVGRINNSRELVEQAFQKGGTHFLEMSGGRINSTELVASLINQKDTIVEGIQYAQEAIDGSMTMLLLTEDGIYAARDRMGRTPVVLGQKEEGWCASFESFAYLNLGYRTVRELGPGEIVLLTAEGARVLAPPREKMKICAFLWTYYGYPTSCYEGVNVEQMRYQCGRILAQNDQEAGAIPEGLDCVAGVPDSGIAHAIGYANESGVPFARPLIKYTPTWPRSFMPPNQAMRALIAHMKLIPVDALIRGKKLLFIDDSIVRGTQLGETAQFLYESGAKEVHIRPACPPIMFGCKYLNFSRSTSEMDLITRRTIRALEGQECPDCMDEYLSWRTDRYARMIDSIKLQRSFTSLRYQTLEGMLAAIGIPTDQVCTYCWNGRE